MMQQSSSVISSSNVCSSSTNILSATAIVGGQSLPTILQDSGTPGNNQGQQPQQSHSLEQNLERLLSLSPIEIKDDYEEKMCRYYLMVQNHIQGKSEHQIHEELTRMCRESQTLSEEVTFGLIVSMLLDNSVHNSHRLFIPIILSNRDGGTQLCNYINQILTEKYLRLHEHSRQRLLLLCKELLRSPIQNIETIYYNLMRNIISGDTSQRNLALAESILDILIEHRLSYDMNVPLIQYALFKYLRLIADHLNSSFQRLLIKEIKYCHCLLTERFGDFLPIGRDLIRLLQQVCRVPEFDQLWKTILTNPTSLAPKFNLVHVMKTRTHRRFIRLLITFDIEKKLNFLVSQVRLGSQRRYQDWFQRQYLNCPENQMLRTDLIRFICNSIHPSNEAIASDLVPRWAVIGWILNSCPHQVTMSWARMALFYDWLMFDIQDTNNNLIMDLEPGLLVMFFSLKNYTGITTALLDFLCRISTEFCPPLTPQIKQGIRNAFVHQVEKRVITSLAFMFDPTKIDQQLRHLITKTFPDLPSLIDHGSMVTVGATAGSGGTGGAVPINVGQPAAVAGTSSSIVVVPNGHHYFPTSIQIPCSSTTTTSCSITTTTTTITASCQSLSSTTTTTLQSTSCSYYSASSSSTAISSYPVSLELSSSGSRASVISTTTMVTSMISSSSVGPPTPVRLLSTSSVVAVVSASSHPMMTHSLLTPNTNPILTNIKPINVIAKQISSTQQSSIMEPLSSGHHNHQSPNNILYAQPQQQQSILPIVMVHSTSKFSDDEDDECFPISSESGSTSSNISTSLLSNKNLVKSSVKRMKKSNSFSSGSSTGLTKQSSNTSTKLQTSTKSSTNIIKSQISSNGSLVTSPTNLTSSSPMISANNPHQQNPIQPQSTITTTSTTATATIINPNNPTDYIANILNSTVMANLNNNQQGQNGQQTQHQIASNNNSQNNSVSVIMSSPSMTSINSKDSSTTSNIDPNPCNNNSSMFNNGIGIKPEIVTIIEEGSDDSLISAGGLSSIGDPTLPFSSPYSSSSTNSFILDHHYNHNNHHSSIFNPAVQQSNHYSLNDDSISSSTIENSYALTAEELQEQIEQITNESIRSLVQRLSEDRNQQSQCELIEQLVQQLLEYPQLQQDEDDNDTSSVVDFIPNLTMVLSTILDEDISQKRFPGHFLHSYSHWLQPDQRVLKSSIDGPIFVMFRALVKTYPSQQSKSMDDNGDNSDNGGNGGNSEKNPTIFKTLMAEMATNNIRIGFLLLHYLVVSGNTFDRMVVYRDLLRFMGKDLATTIMTDLETSICHDLYIFFYLIPAVMKSFPTVLFGNLELLRLILEYGDYNAIQFLVILIQRDQLRFCKKDSLSSIISFSFQLDHIQQHLLWNLLDAHDFPLETYMSIWSKLEDNENNQTLNHHLVQMFKREEPSNQFLKLLMSRDHHKLDDSCFVVNVLVYWAKRYKEKLAEVIGSYVSSIISSPNKRNKRTLNNVSKNQMNRTANIEQLLFYLDEMRQSLNNNKDNDFFSQVFLIVILDQLKLICNAQQKTKYAELFANVPDDNDNNNGKNISGSSSGNTSQRKNVTSSSSSSNSGSSSTGGYKKNQNTKKQLTSNSNNSATESDSSEEDVPQLRTKSNLRNKKKKQLAGFDSD